MHFLTARKIKMEKVLATTLPVIILPPFSRHCYLSVTVDRLGIEAHSTYRWEERPPNGMNEVGWGGKVADV